VTLNLHRDGPPTIGLLLDWLANDYSSSVCFTLAEEVLSRGMRFVCFVGQSLEAIDGMPGGGSFAYALPSPEVLDALVVVTLGTHLSAAEQTRYLERYRPLPMCTYVLECEGIPHVSVDNAAGMHHAVSHLIQFHERRRIAFVRGPAGNNDADLRYAGYRRALADFDLPYDERLDVQGDFRVESGAAAVGRLLRERKVKFDALVAANDAMASGALNELLKRGIRVPEAVAICGFDDVEDARFASVPISSVRQPWRAQARLAVDSLLSQLEGRGLREPVKVAAEFVPRRSCGCGVALEWGSQAFERTHRGEADALDSALLGADPEPLRLAQGLLSVLSTHGIELDVAPALKLVEAYRAGLHGGGQDFLVSFERELGGGLGGRVSLSGWYHGLAFLRREVMALFPGDREARLSGEQLMHVAFERVSYAAERQQAMRRLDFERQGRVLTLAGEAMIGELDMARAAEALREQLPELGLSSFCVVQFGDGDEDVPEFSRLLLAHDTRRDLRPLSNAVFKTKRVVPHGFWPTDRPGGYVLEPLFFQGDRQGFALFELGPRQGAIYLTLREQLSAALKSKSLISQVADQTWQREQAERARQDNEAQIALRVEHSILPRDGVAGDLELAVGARQSGSGVAYYDVRREEHGVWLAIGQITGDGVSASLAVPMLGSIVATLCRQRPSAAPAELLPIALGVLEDTVRFRLGERQSCKLLLARCGDGGQLVFAGDFAGLAVWRRQRSGELEPGVPTEPAGGQLWSGALSLAPGDAVILHTAALTGSDGLSDNWLRALLERRPPVSARAVCDNVLAAADAQSGEIRRGLSLLVARRTGVQ
jgi:DNA-binding LacI/PurR family transcriptional regulator